MHVDGRGEGVLLVVVCVVVKNWSIGKSRRRYNLPVICGNVYFEYPTH